MVDDVAGDVFLRARELVEAFLDVLGKAFELGGFGCGLGHGGPFRRFACFPFRSGWMGGPKMTLEQALHITNRNMIPFDLILGSAAIAPPGATLRGLGHDQPSPHPAHPFRPWGPTWPTLAP